MRDSGHSTSPDSYPFPAPPLSDLTHQTMWTTKLKRIHSGIIILHLPSFFRIIASHRGTVARSIDSKGPNSPYTCQQRSNDYANQFDPTHIHIAYDANQLIFCLHLKSGHQKWRRILGPLNWFSLVIDSFNLQNHFQCHLDRYDSTRVLWGIGGLEE